VMEIARSIAAERRAKAMKEEVELGMIELEAAKKRSNASV